MLPHYPWFHDFCVQLVGGGKQVPLLFTVYALISFNKFKALDAGDAAYDDDFFELPANYRLKTIEELKRGKGYM